jgi:hypothetical protein
MKDTVEYTLQTFKDMLPEGYTLLYVTKSGSQLYGTNSPSSDTDFKGVYAPSMRSLVTKTDVLEVNNDTGNHKSKNTSTDVDCTLDSLNKFFGLLAKGETGALDVLFSMFREDTIIYADPNFLEFMTKNYKKFLSSNTKSFMGYCFQQATRYGLKGKRYDSLMKLFSKAPSLKIFPKDSTVGEWVEEVERGSFDANHVTFTKKENGEYLYVLGKEFHTKMPMKDAEPVLTKMQNMYGARTKASSESADGSTDWKALSHAVRVVEEAQELLSTGFVTFPLKNAEYVKSVKLGEQNVEDVMKLLDEEMCKAELMVSTTTLQSEVDRDILNEALWLLTKWYNYQLK